MSKHSDKAVELFKKGYNCAQAVFGAFSDELDMDFNTAIRIASSFGGGMGRMREVCGALTGAFMVAGMKYGYSDISDLSLKSEHYKLIQLLANRFREMNGSIICRELIADSCSSSSHVPSKRTEYYYKKRPCVELVRLASEHMEDIIISNKSI